MAEADINGDGEIDFAEFQDMMKKLVSGVIKKKESMPLGGVKGNDKKPKIINKNELEKVNPFEKIEVIQGKKPNLIKP